MELHSKRVAILVEDHYEDLELWYPALRLREAGAQVTVVGARAAAYPSKHGMYVQADTTAEQVQVEDVDALVIPSCSSAAEPDNRTVLTALIRTVIQHGKVVAAVWPAGQRLVTVPEQPEERALRLFSTTDEEIADDSLFKDSAVIRQGNFIMARTPVDLPAFCRMIIAALAEAPGPTMRPLPTPER
jgi:protease I